ncbi:MAG: RNA pseudouridine synthase, partial [Planctomycetota bacterium]|nr:RNA pseudouridine synthase [Planctomycetota bacterium]
EILCEDGPILAVNKPAGLLTQGVPEGLPTLESQIRAYVKEKYAKPGNVYLGIPHRLDRPTSGVIVFARNSKAAARLAEQFHDRRVKKEYLAVVEGTPSESEGLLKDWLLKDAAKSHVECVPEGTASAKEASLRYEVLERQEGRALLRLQPLTGRMHQIRVQLASRGWPVLGDVQYGSTAEAPFVDADKAGDVIALHAHRLTIFHPVRYDELTITAPVPESWETLGFDRTRAIVGRAGDSDSP